MDRTMDDGGLLMQIWLLTVEHFFLEFAETPSDKTKQ